MEIGWKVKEKASRQSDDDLSIPVVSIVVAVLNGAETLQRCLDSVKAQTGLSKEILIMDGGSTDGTVGIIESNVEDLSYWQSRRDNGIYDAWNQALKKTKGVWVCFVGADDFFPSERSLEMMLAAVDGDEADLICGRVCLLSEQGFPERKFGEPWVWRRMKRRQVVAHAGMLHRRSVFDRYGEFSAAYKICGDYEFLLRVGNEVRVVFCDEVCLNMGRGLSVTSMLQSLKETRLIQAAHSEIGPSQAWAYFLLGLAKRTFKRILCVS